MDTFEKLHMQISHNTKPVEFLYKIHICVHTHICYSCAMLKKENKPFHNLLFEQKYYVCKELNILFSICCFENQKYYKLFLVIFSVQIKIKI